MDQLVKAGLTTRHRGTRARPAARTLLAAAGLAIIAGIALAAVESARDDDHLEGGRLPSTWLDEGSENSGALNGQPSGTLSGPWSVPSGLTPQPLADPNPAFITYRITSGNALGLTVVNNGLFGNNFRSRSPSFEYPLGSNIDHMPRAGIWVGAVTPEGDTLLTSANVDGSVSSLLPTAELFPVAGTTIVERSMLPESRYYNRRAISEQDFLYSCADTAASLVIPGALDPHRPLNLRIETETLLFSFEGYEAIVIANFKIINIGTSPLYGLVAGFYSELATGWKDPQIANWTSGWFKKKALEYVPDSSLIIEHNYNLGGPPLYRASSYAGIRLLGTKPTPLDSCLVSFNWWNWDPSKRWTDAERYSLISNGNADMRSPAAGTDDPVEVLSVTGNNNTAFGTLLDGDTLTVSFAFLGGQDQTGVTGRNARADLLYNSGKAQAAYNADFVIPRPPPSPGIRVIPGHNTVTLEWEGAVWRDSLGCKGTWTGPEVAIEIVDTQTKERAFDFEGYRIYVSEERTQKGFRRILERDVRDSIGYDTGLVDIFYPGGRDSSVIAAAGPDTLWTDSTCTVVDTIMARPEIRRYRYTIDGVRDGFKYWVAVTAFDRGSPSVGSLESGIAQNLQMVIPGSPASVDGRPKVTVFPNPYRGDAAWDGSLRRDRYLWFANLPPICTIRIYTLAGDLVDTIDFDQATYKPTDIRGIFDPTDSRNPERDLPKLSGGMAAWDLVSRKDQGVASGLYLYAVEEPGGGRRQVGKFLIVK